jgi:hypothetical protein
MKIITLFIVWFMSLPALAHWKVETISTLREFHYACQGSEVIIDQVEANKEITGHIKGLPGEAYERFKMVFYVKTNVWYVHPYAYYEGQAEGYSYANLNANGEFKIRTVKRDVPAKALAAVLVPKAYKIRSHRWWLNPLAGVLGGLLKFQCAHTIIEGAGDF